MRPQLRHRLGAGAVGQPVVDDRHVERFGFGQPGGVGTGGGPADHGQVGMLVEEHREALGHHPVVLDDEHPVGRPVSHGSVNHGSVSHGAVPAVGARSRGRRCAVPTR